MERDPESWAGSWTRARRGEPLELEWVPDPSFPSGQVNIQFQVDRPQHRTAWNYHYVACALEDDGHAIIDTRRFFMHSVQHVSMFRRAVIMGDHPEWGTLALTVEGYDMIQLPKDGQAR